MKENCLILGEGGREIAVLEAAFRSCSIGQVFIAPGNAGAPHALRRSVDMTSPLDVVRLAKQEKIGVVIIGPERPLYCGVSDALREAGIAVFAPSKACAQLEGSKLYARQLGRELGQPMPAWEPASTMEEARRIINDFYDRFGRPPVIKADGPCDGKGVVVPCSLEEAYMAASDMLDGQVFGQAGSVILIEECLVGTELSVIGLTDGRRVRFLPLAQDYKRAFEGDMGPNTGSMGAYSPAQVDDRLLEQIKRTFFLPTLKALREKGAPYIGFLYGGFMLTKDGPKLIEWNTRLGDPEAQTILPRLESDLFELILAALSFTGLEGKEIKVSRDATVCIALVSGEYPGRCETGLPIMQNGKLPHGVHVFFGRAECDAVGNKRTAGGRVVYIVGKAPTIPQARRLALEGANVFSWPRMRFRRDIAKGVS